MRVAVLLLSLLSVAMAQTIGPMVPGGGGGGGGGSGPTPPSFPTTLTTSPFVAGNGVAGPKIPTSSTQPSCCGWTRNYVISGLSGSTVPTLWSQHDSGFLAGITIAGGANAGELEGLVFPKSNVSGTCGTATTACAALTLINNSAQHMVTVTYCPDVTNTLGTVQIYVDGAAVGTPATNNVGYAPSLEPSTIFSQSTVNYNVYLLQAFNSRCWQSTDVAAMYSAVQANSLPGYSNALNSGIDIYMPMECASSACASTVADISGNSNSAFYDTTPPVVAVTLPTSAEVVSGTFALTASATDTGGSGVNYCQFLIDSTNVGPQVFLASSPNTYTYSWNSASVIDASHTATVTCVDRVGNSATSSSVTFTTSNSVMAGNWYFSATVGSDTNNCKTTGTPCKTITKLNSLTYGEGDTIHLNATDGTFTDACGSLTTSNATSSFSIPITITAYNAGQWELTAPCTGASGGVASNGVSVVIENGSIHPATAGQGVINAQGGVWIHNDSGTSPISAVVQNMTIGDFNNLFDPGGSISADILLYGYPGPFPSAIQPQIIGNTVCGATNASSDAAGVSGFGNSVNITQVVITGNISCNNGGSAGADETNGFLFSGYDTGTFNFNLAHDISWNTFTCGGPYGVIADSTYHMTVEFFESYNVQTSGTLEGYSVSGACDHGGTDLDQDTNDSVFQDYYVHSNYGPGTLLFQQFVAFGWASNTVRYSIDENNGEVAQNGVGGLAGLNYVASQGAASTSWAYNNTIFNNLTLYSALNISPSTFFNGTASISGTTLTVVSQGATNLSPGQVLATSGSTALTANTVIIRNLTGSGVGSTWLINNSQTVATEAITGVGSGLETVSAGGTGGTPGVTTFTVSSPTCATSPTLQGVINTSGVLTGILNVVNTGQCSANLQITSNLTGGSLTGGTANVSWNTGCYSGADIASSDDTTAIIQNNIFNTPHCGPSSGGVAGVFTPIHDTVVRTQALQYINNDMVTSNSGSLSIVAQGTTYTTVAAFQAGQTGSSGNLTTAINYAGTPPFGSALTWTPSTATVWPIPTNQPNSYLLSSMGALNDAGVAPQSSWQGGVPTRDFYNTSVPNGGSGGWSIGASGLQ
jgi:hypothetical protein